MPKVSIVKESFTGRDGKPVEYERLQVISDKVPSLKAEFRVEKNDLALVQAILMTDGQGAK